MVFIYIVSLLKMYGVVLKIDPVVSPNGNIALLWLKCSLPTLFVKFCVVRGVR